MSWNTIETMGWGRVHKATSQIARPERAARFAALAAESPAPAFGNRRSYGDACLNDEGKAFDTTRLDRMTGFDRETGTLTVEGGAKLGDLAAALAPQGWLPAVMPGTGFATVGGAIAMDVHGKNHHHAGTFGQHVAEITLQTPQGEKVITPDDPLFAATVGGLGQTGAILSAKLTLLPAKGDVMMVTERRATDLEAFLGLLDGSEATYTVGWIDATATGAGLGRGILEEGETGAGLVKPAKRGKTVPMDAPGFALSSPVVKLFNKAYYGRVPARGRTSVKPIQDFFFPLDKIHDWNRLYGKRGFHQFQCVLPVSETSHLTRMVEEIATSGLASPLAVLKRTGPGRGGMMSFPMEGYTLAVDFPNRDGAEELIARLNDQTAEAGGRIYFAKDALATRDQVAGMYPERGDWAGIVNKIDPEGALETDLVRRLDLRSM